MMELFVVVLLTGANKAKFQSRYVASRYQSLGIAGILVEPSRDVLFTLSAGTRYL